jgi:hypothetical protein
MEVIGGNPGPERPPKINWEGGIILSVCYLDGTRHIKIEATDAQRDTMTENITTREIYK